QAFHEFGRRRLSCLFQGKLQLLFGDSGLFARFFRCLFAPTAKINTDKGLPLFQAVEMLEDNGVFLSRLYFRNVQNFQCVHSEVFFIILKGGISPLSDHGFMRLKWRDFLSIALVWRYIPLFSSLLWRFLL